MLLPITTSSVVYLSCGGSSSRRKWAESDCDSQCKTKRVQIDTIIAISLNFNALLLFECCKLRLNKAKVTPLPSSPLLSSYYSLSLSFLSISHFLSTDTHTQSGSQSYCSPRFTLLLYFSIVHFCCCCYTSSTLLLTLPDSNKLHFASSSRHERLLFHPPPTNHHCHRCVCLRYCRIIPLSHLFYCCFVCLCIENTTNSTLRPLCSSWKTFCCFFVLQSYYLPHYLLAPGVSNKEMHQMKQ